MNKYRLILLLLLMSIVLVFAGPNCGADHGNEDEKSEQAIEESHEGHDHDEHEGHDHDEDEEHDHNDEPKKSTCSSDDGHDHDEHEDEPKKKSACSSDDGHDHGDDEHGGEGHIELSPEMIKRIGLTVNHVQRRPVTSYISVPGEVKINEDRLAHINPSYPSKCVSVYVRQGQYVKRGALLATLTNRETLSNYNIYAPIAGRIISKHLTKGEVVSEEDRLFSIANLSTVWAEFAVPQDRLEGIKQKNEMRISLVSHADEFVTGKVDFIDPIADPQTRRVMVRAIIQNKDNQFRPGSYVTARIDYGDAKPVASVELDAVQMVSGEEMLFVPAADEKGAFKPVEVKTGRRSVRYVEILSGIESGDEYVNAGAFTLKAEMVTANMDPHAGHNH